MQDKRPAMLVGCCLMITALLLAAWGVNLSGGFPEGYFGCPTCEDVTVEACDGTDSYVISKGECSVVGEICSDTKAVYMKPTDCRTGGETEGTCQSPTETTCKWVFPCYCVKPDGIWKCAAKDTGGERVPVTADYCLGT